MNLDYIVCCIMFLMKTVEISKTLNSSLRHFTPSTGNGNGIVTIDKYQILNDHVEKLEASDDPNTVDPPNPDIFKAP